MELDHHDRPADTWTSVGGPGSMSKFPTGVYVDAQGVLQPLVKEESAGRLVLRRVRQRAARSAGDDARRDSPLRMVSLPGWRSRFNSVGGRPAADRGDAALGRLAAHTIRFRLSGTGDLVLAGPAGDWKPAPKTAQSAATPASRWCGWTTWSSSCG